MKTAIPSTSKDGQNPTRSSHAHSSGLYSGHLAQLAAMMNQSPQVQTQFKLRDEIQNSERVQSQMALAAEINYSQTEPVAQPRQEEKAPAQREEAPPNQTGLPNQLKSGVESLSGLSLDDVKVHYNSDKPAQLNALAYAQGTDIHVAPGQQKHLPHEAWHIVQQKQGRVRPTMQMKVGVPVNDEPGLEKEADAMGRQALHHASEEKTGTHQLSKQASHAITPSAAIQRRQSIQSEFTQTPSALDVSRLPGVVSSIEASDLASAPMATVQCVNWKGHGATKFNTIWYFKDADKAKEVLSTELGEEMSEFVKEKDWELVVKFATDKENGADEALKLLFGTAEEHKRIAQVKQRRSDVEEAGLSDGVDDLELSDIATRALKLGISLYIEGNLNGSIGSWSLKEVNDAVDELDYDNFELVEIADKEEGDKRTGIVIRDAHKATDKKAQGKGSVYRPSDTQANINMRVLGKLVQVHLNVS